MGRIAAAVVLGVGATETSGALSVLLILAAFTAACSAFASIFDYWGGLSEWRQ